MECRGQPASLDGNFYFIKQVISAQRMRLVDLLFSVQKHPNGWVSLLPPISDGTLLLHYFQNSVLVHLLTYRRQDFIYAIKTIQKQRGSELYAQIIQWLVYIGLWKMPKQKRDSFYAKAVRITKDMFPAVPDTEGVELYETRNIDIGGRPQTPILPTENLIDLVSGYIPPEQYSDRISRKRGEGITPPAPPAIPSNEAAMCFNCRIVFEKGTLFVPAGVNGRQPNLTVIGKPCPLCNAPLTGEVSDPAAPALPVMLNTASPLLEPTNLSDSLNTAGLGFDLFFGDSESFGLTPDPFALNGDGASQGAMPPTSSSVCMGCDKMFIPGNAGQITCNDCQAFFEFISSPTPAIVQLAWSPQQQLSAFSISPVVTSQPPISLPPTQPSALESHGAYGQRLPNLCTSTTMPGRNGGLCGALAPLPRQGGARRCETCYQRELNDDDPNNPKRKRRRCLNE